MFGNDPVDYESDDDDDEAKEQAKKIAGTMTFPPLGAPPAAPLQGLSHSPFP
jgi:hypothetical protein